MWRIIVMFTLLVGCGNSGTGTSNSTLSSQYELNPQKNTATYTINNPLYANNDPVLSAWHNDVMRCVAPIVQKDSYFPYSYPIITETPLEENELYVRIEHGYVNMAVDGEKLDHIVVEPDYLYDEETFKALDSIIVSGNTITTCR